MSARPAPSPIELPRLLIGEGIEEVRFFTALLEHLRIRDIQVEQCAGKRALQGYLAAQCSRSGFGQVHSMAIVQDADTDPQARLAAVRDAIRACGLQPPACHGEFSEGRPRVGVFIMPDGARPGMLEDLCLGSVADDAALACVREFLDCVRSRCGRAPSPAQKARVHAWLASQETPDRRLGEAAQAGLWPWQHTAFAGLIAFLRRM